MSAESAQVSLVRKLIAALNAVDRVTYTACLSQDLKHIILPTTLMPEQGYKDSVAFTFGLLEHPKFRNYNHVIDRIYENGNSVILQTHATANSPVGDWKQEYIIIFDVVGDSDDERKIVKIQEFVDSRAAVEFFGKWKPFLMQEASSLAAPPG
ncbi:hypothetical protein HDU83_006362 [Entophlyctis luteolus]|nr:hypothetical protein HDU83_006362 [Entophlyctis luteolus]KAJ3380433.1 hypothetical protein HDU84_005932 [Entophlyctis sp. JEL0112]